ncbi:class I SAM-dependent methyltransferase [Halobacillus salinarum]|uniref:Class I SAM-dependent methyltransferase n=1 Tax=Halobacillus salinarum TaxID=2932257 RepID=A0ABY4EI15_9BACI|nr:class I SAM-dependent methyltransferase [Halobacillus salinarum]UOQ43640.1 class I SAM-dependent methyltransferase [Halobacillus salinarum]
MKQERLIEKFDRQADKYERRRRKETKNHWRRKIFTSARGKTLEAAVGAGMNFAFLPADIDYTGVDFSREMLKRAEAAAGNYPFTSQFILSDVEALQVPEDSFDTIISSGTLCAYPEPGIILNLFQQWCRPEGQVLLMEHGLFDSASLAFLQKIVDPVAHSWLGCHQDRNILELVSNSKLKIVRQEKGFHGALNLIWAKP